MSEHDGGRFFDERVAAVYDDHTAGMFDPAVVMPVVDVLAELAGNGAALELGIGTGRIALPLAARGVPVHGIDASEAMVARLRAKPGGEAIGVTIGDFATTRGRGPVLARVPRLQHDLQSPRRRTSRWRASRTSLGISTPAATS